MWGKKNKKPAIDGRNLRRSERRPLEGDVYIKRPGKPTLHSTRGNMSDSGLFLELNGQHDLQKGKRVEIILVNKKDAVREFSRMSAIVLRIQPTGVALVTYDSSELKQILGS